MSPAQLETADAVLLVGSNLQKEQPLIALRLRKAIAKGAVVLAINPMDYLFNFTLTAKDIVAPQRFISSLKQLASALENNGDHMLAASLKGKQSVCVILGELALHHPQAAVIRSLAQKIANVTRGKLTIMTDGANSAGGWLAGAIPHRLPAGVPVNHVGLSAYEMAEKPRKGYLLLNIEPELDCANAAKMTDALKQAKCVIALSLYRNPVLEQYADIIFPIAPFTETSGTFVNAAGTWQSFAGVATPYGSSRPAWKILRVLGNFLHLQGFDYEESTHIRHELLALVDKMEIIPARFADMPIEEMSGKLTRVGEVPIYAKDSLVRRSNPLQTAQVIMEGVSAVVRLHHETAKKLALSEGATLTVQRNGGKRIKYDM